MKISIRRMAASQNMGQGLQDVDQADPNYLSRFDASRPRAATMRIRVLRSLRMCREFQCYAGKGRFPPRKRNARRRRQFVEQHRVPGQSAGNPCQRRRRRPRQ